MTNISQTASGAIANVEVESQTEQGRETAHKPSHFPIRSFQTRRESLLPRYDEARRP